MDNILKHTDGIVSVERFGTKNRVFTDIVRSGLIVHFDPMNLDSYDRSGSIIYDLTGNGHTGTLSGGYSFTADGGIYFDGVNGNLTYTLNFPTAMTHLIYVKSNQPTWTNYNLLGANRGPNGFSMHTWAGSTYISVGVYGADGIGNGVSVTPAVPVDLPQMYVLSTDGFNSTFYINQSKYIGSNLSVGRDNTVTDTLYIANDAVPYNSRFGEMTMYTHLLYDRELSYDEIKQNHNALSSRF
jgi:hypothetical protein